MFQIVLSPPHAPSPGLHVSSGPPLPAPPARARVVARPFFAATRWGERDRLLPFATQGILGLVLGHNRGID